jgi:hypothetical protein
VHNATQNLSDILRDVFEHSDKHKAVVIYDLNSPLSCLLTEAYKIALPNAIFINFHDTTSDEILALIDSLNAHDFVALVQSASFRLSAFRIRVELFKKGLKVVEHPHLGRMPTDIEVKLYVDSLAYDKEYFHHTGKRLQSLLHDAKNAIVYCDDEQLIYSDGFEPPKINIGDYSQMNNMGGQFPIGEVFTEAKELKNLNGRAKVMAFGDINYKVNIPSFPITITIENGQLTDTKNSTPEFDAILGLIKEEEGGVVLVRELGLGLNRAFGKDKVVSDMGTYERMCGIHLSLGAKHGIYAKEGHKRNSGKFHIDVMLDTTSFTIDDRVVFHDESWLV